MQTRVDYRHDDGISWITMDDGKANALSPTMQDEIAAAFDRAEEDNGVVVLSGRPGVFCGGFDMNVMGAADRSSIDMVIGGFRLAAKILAYPRPVVIASTGHAVAMGAFLVLAGDYRVGTNRPSKIVANEVAIGLTLPRTAMEMLRQRLTPAAFQRAALLSETFDPVAAVTAGFLDEIVDDSALLDRAGEVAAGYLFLDEAAQRATKQRVRAPLLAILEQATADDAAEHEALLAAAG